MLFWQGFIALTVLVALFILWPTVIVRADRKRELRDGFRDEVNESVFADHIEDLKATRGRGEIGSQEFKILKEDLHRTLITENQAAFAEGDRPIVSNLYSRLPVIALVVAVPMITLIIYSQIGAKSDWNIYQLMQENNRALMSGQVSGSNNPVGRELIERLQKRLEDDPDNVQNWYLLAGTAVQQTDYDEAVRAYGKVLELQPDAPNVMAELAQALFLRAGNTITPEVRRYTNDALQLDPNMPTALGLAGIDAFQSGRYTDAIDSWKKAVAQLDPSSSASQVLSEGIARAQLALEQHGGNRVTSSTEDTETKAAAVSLRARVTLGEDVTAEPGDTVFVYARAWQGPKMPLAIQKITVADLPKTITLDESMAMAPGMDLGSFPQVELVARISKSGSAVPEPGDWQVAVGPIIVAEQEKRVALKITEQVE